MFNNYTTLSWKFAFFRRNKFLCKTTRKKPPRPCQLIMLICSIIAFDCSSILLGISFDDKVFNTGVVNSCIPIWFYWMIDSRRISVWWKMLRNRFFAIPLFWKTDSQVEQISLDELEWTRFKRMRSQKINRATFCTEWKSPVILTQIKFLFVKPNENRTDHFALVLCASN